MPRPTSPSWQSVLERSIQLPGERQRLVNALGINPMTLNRWVKAETQPNRNHLIDLLRYVQPQYRQELRNAMRENYTDIDSCVVDEAPEHIYAEYYTQILTDI